MSMLHGKTRMIVARFQDGKMIKGTTHDFFPNKTDFHIYEWGNEEKEAVSIVMAGLKAVFFVKTYEGNKEHKEDTNFREMKPGQGRKINIHFHDGEMLAGWTNGYNPGKQGFFMVPVDETSNNIRIYIVNSSVKEVKWEQ